ncbi:RidA family protein [Photobacterium sp. TY1-4]|uniref:RidA family protein n=1 Tax=Photobacterium sp. TY1-4 TaxID=2899122 RepID=UPI0021C1EF8C|nr:RidA family protein [Photobacterium sp. TY1-4]UXI04324.1 RidA family protein [Photobacterium sp. TY1-4]
MKNTNAQHALKHHNPTALFNPTPFGFCHSVSAPSSGELVFISGQSGGEDLDHTLSHDFSRQVEFTLKNLGIALAEYGLQFEDIVKITVLIVDHNADKLAIWSDAVSRTWDPAHLPASTLIPVPALALKGMQIEVDAIAFKAHDRETVMSESLAE